MKFGRFLSAKILSFVMILSFSSLSAFGHVDDELFKVVEIKDGSILSVLDCVALAFKNSPKIKRQKYNLDIIKSDLGTAKSRYFPILTAGAGFYNENNSNSIYYDKHYRELPNVYVTISKMIWDFGKTTANIKMEEFLKLAAEYEFMDSLCATLFDVKLKYYNLLKAKALLKIAENNVEINKKFTEIAKNNEDIETAKFHLNKAQLDLVKAKNDVYNAKADLSNMMYIDFQPKYEIQNTKTFDFNDDFNYKTKKLPHDFDKYEFNFKKEDAYDIAYKNSPDLQVLIATKKAMEQSLLYIKRTYFPELSANAGYNFNNSNLYSDNNTFQVSVNLNSSINLMELKHSIKGADAQLKLADNEITLFKKDLYYDIKRAFNNINKTEHSLPAAQTAAKQALDTLSLVEKKYKNNLLNYVALQEARKDYISSVKSYVDSLYDYNLALIQVEMAMHYHLTDIHHKTEHAMVYHSEELINHLNEVLGCDENDTNKKSKNTKKPKKTKENKENL